ncbi:MAG: YebC/PmpR family DNA-binding transcriptional regulator [Planctomycetota bacterium]|nr:MAG: YebC/PmpR family DNA-binding transcriptional regulator [Planctomycetota bacterium]
MAGHSKWANIRHRKDRQDKKKGKIWSKCSRAIIAAARAGGGDPATNLALRYAIDEAKYANMPKDTITRAIDKGAGSAGGDAFESVSYEGYGPNGVAVIADALTDNRNRTAPEVRSTFTKHGGNLGATGCVGYMFETKGQIRVSGSVDEEQVMEIALEGGANDVQPPEPIDDEDPGFWTVETSPADFATVKEAIEQAGLEIIDAEITKIPDNTITLDSNDARKLMNLIDALEDSDDVQKVYTNADIPDEVLATLD